jgi:D-alanine-D-alanine ligase
VVAVARHVAVALRARGFRAWPQPARPPVARLIRALERRKPDVVFNLSEGFGGRSGGEAWLTSLLELLRLPYTGCPPEAQGLCRQKAATKRLLIGAGLPTAPFALVESARDCDAAQVVLPAIVKPEAEDASLGIDQRSVALSGDELLAQVVRVAASHGPRVLVERYLPGPEYNVGVLALPDPVPLPIAEVVFDPPPGAWPILTYEAKWAAGSIDDLASPVRCPAPVEPELAARLGELAVAAFRATGCRDYARVDFRLDERGEPMILEANPNPDLDPEAGLARAARASGRDFDNTLADLARLALQRGARDA